MNGTSLSLTLDDCKALLDCYEAMAAAAAENDWEKLAGLGERAAKIRDDTSKRATVNVMSDADQRKMAALIERILFLDGEVRSHAAPALESIRKMLTGAVRGRTVHAAYGAHGP